MAVDAHRPRPRSGACRQLAMAAVVVVDNGDSIHSQWVMMVLGHWTNWFQELFALDSVVVSRWECPLLAQAPNECSHWSPAMLVARADSQRAMMNRWWTSVANQWHSSTTMLARLSARPSSGQLLSWAKLMVRGGSRGTMLEQSDCRLSEQFGYSILQDQRRHWVMIIYLVLLLWWPPWWRWVDPGTWWNCALAMGDLRCADDDDRVMYGYWAHWRHNCWSSAVM